MKNLDLKQTEVQEQLRSALEGQDEKEIAAAFGAIYFT